MRDQSDVVICEPLRTPIGRFGGTLKEQQPAALAARLISEIVARTKIDPTRRRGHPGPCLSDFRRARHRPGGGPRRGPARLGRRHPDRPPLRLRTAGRPRWGHAGPLRIQRHRDRRRRRRHERGPVLHPGGPVGHPGPLASAARLPRPRPGHRGGSEPSPARGDDRDCGEPAPRVLGLPGGPGCAGPAVAAARRRSPAVRPLR